jgi:catechol 2,3-dioxygenase-like lactoylglutathione lyase family enzyme
MNAITQVRSQAAIVPQTRPVDLKFQVATIPVSDVERSKAFYGKLGWRLDADFAVGDHFRVVQFTPPGSPASIHFGKGATPAQPGSAQGLFLVVSDIEAARADLISRGADVSEFFHVAGPGHPPIPGLDPERRSYFSYATFKDPDGNTWLLQEVTTRFPGRVDADDTKFASVADLASALRRAAAAHGEHEKRVGGQHDQIWPDWYAEYLVAEQSGKPLPQ